MTKYVNTAKSGDKEFLVYFLDSQSKERDHFVTLCECEDENIYFKKLEGCNVKTPLSEDLTKMDKVYLNKTKEHALCILEKRAQKRKLFSKGKESR